MASNEVLNISDRFKLIKATVRDSWPWAVDPKRVLVLFLPWLNSQEKHFTKYIDVYSNLGLDVLCITCQMKDFLWPPQSKKAGQQLIKILQNECQNYEVYFIHAMSVGGYNLTTFRMLMGESGSSKHLVDRVCGVIYDSPVVGAGKGGILNNRTDRPDGDESTEALSLMVRGIVQSMSDSNALYYFINFLAKMYFTATKSVTVDFYTRTYDVVRDKPLKVPTLVMFSKDDKMSDFRVMLKVGDIWKTEHSVPLQIQLWDKSEHAQHLMLHRKEYLDVQRKFMSKVFGKSKL